MIEDTGGGLLCNPHDPADLAAVIKQMVGDTATAAEYGRRAQRPYTQRYNMEAMARQTIELYRRVVERP